MTTTHAGRLLPVAPAALLAACSGGKEEAAAAWPAETIAVNTGAPSPSPA